MTLSTLYISWIVIRRNWGGKGRDHFPNTMHLKSINTVFLIVKHYLIYLKTHLKSAPCNIVKLKYVFKVHKKCNSVLHDIYGIFFPPRNEKKQGRVIESVSLFHNLFLFIFLQIFFCTNVQIVR